MTPQIRSFRPKMQNALKNIFVLGNPEMKKTNCTERFCAHQTYDSVKLFQIVTMKHSPGPVQIYTAWGNLLINFCDL